MKGLFQFIIVMLFIVLFINGCSHGKSEEVTVYEMKSFSEVDEDSITVFTNLTDVNLLVTAFNHAKKEPGIVNMIDPEYKVELRNDSYFLWINEEHGTIMNLKDTHTIYTLSQKSAKAIYELLKGK